MALLFCPTCGNMLELEEGGRQSEFFMSQKTKKIEPVLGGEAEWRSAPRTEHTRCSECGHNVAFYQQVQNRSADEPATTYFRCTRCAKVWQEA
ncbi:hypothetical protein CHLNCDRAFT_138851 [Chlorella variabilis]|uniref:TFIIS-type domain-containing protein n=1 Tax=Chlorella variabilis TaxID=554065 RepID=E1ZP68_CHLVA|nr:hypothetical protein CHLNCDRAFT_138851 [Chlorella variabilis]EFN52393.1 hypothetical protein CHLNCDRAFT_138851 [Chlorella variabilis]|eukprot:XP_005844495.1 hypothetical protein CHLNCDRAFT_138851 [Chlorella variabilis]